MLGDGTIYDLQVDHEHATRLLDQLEVQIDLYRGGGVPDFDLIREVLESTLTFASLHHRLSQDRTLAGTGKVGAGTGKAGAATAKTGGTPGVDQIPASRT